MVAWQWLFGRIAQTQVGFPEVFVVSASVWLAYAADRWFEGWRLSKDQIRTPRHRFYHDHRVSVAIVWIGVLAGDIGVAVIGLSHREFMAGLCLLLPTLAYLLSHQLLHRHHPWRVPKEFCVAGLIAGGAAVFVLAVPGINVRPLVAPVLLFAGLCFANVALIADWEQEVDETHGQVSLARQFRHAGKLSRVLPLALIVATFAARTVAPAASCLCASSVLLLTVDVFEPRIGWQAARVLVDVALLTPGLVWAVHLFR